MSKTAKKICTLSELIELRKKWKSDNEEVVFTNGCFDIIHLGHVDYLEKAHALGTKLILGLNTDQSVKKLKGESRPINNEYARARVLASLEFIDAVILFGEDTPLKLIQNILPDVLVKGADYKIEDIVGGKEVVQNGGEVKTISFVEGYSTSNIIKKSKSS